MRHARRRRRTSQEAWRPKRTAGGGRAKKILALLALTLLFGGCATAVIEGGNIAKDKSTIKKNIVKARAGDPVAQFKIGDAYCCSVHQGSGFYNTRVAVGWLCASASQGYGLAMYKLGKIYSGDVVDGVRLGRRLAQLIAGTSENRAVAYAWLAQAKAHGMVEASEPADEVWNDMSVAEQNAAQRLLQNGLRTTCRWEDAT